MEGQQLVNSHPFSNLYIKGEIWRTYLKTEPKREAMYRLAFRCGRARLAAEAITAGEVSRRQLFTSSNQPGRLAGKVALITGAAGGIGKATATEFIRNGAKVIIADINHHLGQQTATDLGPNAAFTPCDVTNESHIAAAIDLAVTTHGGLDILHNNAGIAGSLPLSIASLDLSDFDHTMAVNLRSAVMGIKHAARVMVPRRTGCILCTASVTAILGGLASIDYSVSKAAILALVRSAAAELGRHGIRVNCISPNPIPTLLEINAMKKFYPGFDEEQLAEITYAAGELAGARCEVEDVAMAAVYLASNEAKYVSGHNLVVDGGLSTAKMFAFPPP